MRKTHRCPKCDHDRVLHVAQVADRTGATRKALDADHPTFDDGTFHPWRIARVWNPEQGFFDGPDAAAGLVEAFICRACGYTELYTRGIEQLEPDGEYVRELRATGPSSGTYR